MRRSSQIRRKTIAVDRALHGEVQIALRELRVAQRKIAREICTPLLDLVKECVVDLGRAALRLGRFGETSNEPLRIASRAKIFAISSHSRRTLGN